MLEYDDMSNLPDHRTHLWTVVLDWFQVKTLSSIHRVACDLLPTIVDLSNFSLFQLLCRYELFPTYSRCVPLEQFKEGSCIKQLPENGVVLMVKLYDDTMTWQYDNT